ncbi:MAG: GNAT family N-acetyltransferase [Hyphomicrobiaceae bacterium]
MADIIRSPRLEELPRLSALGFRSKAFWGYDEAFMEACRAELSFQPGELTTTSLALMERDMALVAVAQVKLEGPEAELAKLFVEPAAIGSGAGWLMFDWAWRTARALGAHRLVIEADPHAAPFYRRMGARDTGVTRSHSISGRLLPRLVLALRPDTGNEPS